jgi:hypothetical protein
MILIIKIIITIITTIIIVMGESEGRVS